ITNSSFHILKAKNLINITFGDSVKYVPSYLCYHLEKLTNVTIPNSVKTIGESAFYNCSSLENIILGNSIQHIESGAFYGCSLKTLILPKSISRIDSYSLCETLDTIICHSNTPPQLEYQRESIYEKCVLVVPHFFASDYKKSGNWKNFKNILTFRPPKYKITAIANDSVMGNVKGSGIYYETREIELTAIPNKDYHFTQWTDGNKQSRRTIVVSQDSTFIAEFAINPYNVKIIQSENGTVNDISGKYNYEDEITLIATANEGYKFKKWSDDNTENPRTLVITKDIELSAIFEHIDTSTENILDNQTNIHSNNGVLHILGETIDYQILDISGRLIYRGNQATLPLPRGIYLIIIENKAQKIVL
ncbi:MAG: leucine-rich repeat domain-containing protein, partial [Paludibacteraceae bacterium]|nr:leucine-rich repeat domain-containing protein [Paludibacteraceae bacterium]